MTDHRELQELATLYALGILEGEDEARFLTHVAEGCEECAVALRETREVGDALAEAVPPMTPSASQRERLLRRARAGSGRVRPSFRRGPALALAAGFAMVVLGGLSLQLSLELEEEELQRAALELDLEDARRELTAAETELRATEEELAAAEDTLGMLTGPAGRAVSLAGAGPFPGASARAFVDPEAGRLILFVHGLPPAPSGQSYQLWVIVGDRPVSAGVFDVSSEAETRFEARPVDELGPGIGVAVTIEPEGGVGSPTGPMVLVGS